MAENGSQYQYKKAMVKRARKTPRGQFSPETGKLKLGSSHLLALE